MSILTISDADVVAPGFLDSDNPRSLVNIAPLILRPYIAAIPRETFTWKEAKLKSRAKPDFTTKCLRINFWKEYVHAQDRNKSMRFSELIKGVTTKEYFLHLAETNLCELAYVIIPPKEYAITQAEIFEESLDQLRECLLLSPIEEKTVVKEGANGSVTTTTTRTVNVNLLAEKRKISEILSDRIQGALDRKVNVSGVLQHTVSKSDTDGFIDMGALDMLEAEIADTEK